MKRFYFFLSLAFLATPLFAQPCLPDGITFTSQQEINDFAANYPGCTEIEGKLEIFGPSISNLSGLSAITKVEGDILIHDNTALVTLEGLDNITVLEGSLMIWGNSALISLTGLQGLTSTGNHLAIGTDLNSCACPVGNWALTSLTGLHNITTVGGGVYLYKNTLLSDLSGLDKLSVVGGDLALADNWELLSLNGLESLTSVGGEVSIGIDTDELPHGNDKLVNLNGLENLNAIGTNLVILSNELLTDISAFNHPITIAGNLSITQNPNLAECAVEGVCNYIDTPNGTIEILDNAEGCYTTSEVEAACIAMGLEAKSPLVDFEIYPNPTGGPFFVSGQGMLSIRNVMGQLVLQQLVESNIQLDLSNAPAGIFWLELQNKKGRSVKKLVRK